MHLRKLLVCLFLTISIVGVFARPPRNVVEMKEAGDVPENVNKDMAVNDDTKEDANLQIKPIEHVEQFAPGSEDDVKQKQQLKALKEAAQIKKELENSKTVLKEDDLEPPDHLDAVKLEQDGMLNKDYKKEIFLGNHEEIEDDSVEMAESKIKDIFAKVDTDSDGKMCFPEVEGWIIDKTQEHFDEALQENDHVFKHMDPDGDGLVDWKEYYVHFLLAKGYPLQRATKHVEDYDEIELEYDDREKLIRYKFKWTDADIDPMDNKLSKKEFLAFRHPEQSEQALENMLKTIIQSLDRDDDGILTEKEFVSLPLGDIDDEEQAKLDKEWQDERRAEFRNQIDKAGKGHATKDDLKAYLDPRNPDQAKTDAKNLIDMMDNDADLCITWNEVLDHRDVFLQSKVINIKRILHDEF